MISSPTSTAFVSSKWQRVQNANVMGRHSWYGRAREPGGSILERAKQFCSLLHRATGVVLARRQCRQPTEVAQGSTHRNTDACLRRRLLGLVKLETPLAEQKIGAGLPTRAVRRRPQVASGRRAASCYNYECQALHEPFAEICLRPRTMFEASRWQRCSADGTTDLWTSER